LQMPTRQGAGTEPSFSLSSFWLDHFKSRSKFSVRIRLSLDFNVYPIGWIDFRSVPLKGETKGVTNQST